MLQESAERGDLDRHSADLGDDAFVSLVDSFARDSHPLVARVQALTAAKGQTAPPVDRPPVAVNHAGNAHEGQQYKTELDANGNDVHVYANGDKVRLGNQAGFSGELRGDQRAQLARQISKEPGGQPNRPMLAQGVPAPMPLDRLRRRRAVA